MTALFLSFHPHSLCFFFCPILLAGNSNTSVRRTSIYRYPFVIPALISKDSLLCMNIYVSIDFWYLCFISLSCYLFPTLNMNECLILLNDFSTSVDMII